MGLWFCPLSMLRGSSSNRRGLCCPRPSGHMNRTPLRRSSTGPLPSAYACLRRPLLKGGGGRAKVRRSPVLHSGVANEQGSKEGAHCALCPCSQTKGGRTATSVLALIFTGGGLLPFPLRPNKSSLLRVATTAWPRPPQRARVSPSAKRVEIYSVPLFYAELGDRLSSPAVRSLLL